MELEYCEAGENVLKIAEASLESIERIFGASHESTISLKYSKAWALSEMNKNEEAWTVLNELRPLAKLGNGIPCGLTVMILYVVCTQLDRQGDFKAKLEVIEDIEAIQVKKHGLQHQATLHTLHRKAITLFELGKLNESLKLFRRVYKLRKQVLGPDHVFTKLTKNYIDQVVNCKPGF